MLMSHGFTPRIDQSRTSSRLCYAISIFLSKIFLAVVFSRVQIMMFLHSCNFSDFYTHESTPVFVIVIVCLFLAVLSLFMLWKCDNSFYFKHDELELEVVYLLIHCIESWDALRIELRFPGGALSMFLDISSTFLNRLQPNLMAKYYTAWKPYMHFSEIFGTVE